MNPIEVIATKRDGIRALTGTQVTEFINGYLAGTVSDAQAAAFAMAVHFNGLNADETAALTTAMVNSGTTLTWNTQRPIIDKHSTGGVGDKISLILAPLLATLGAAVPMLSGRGLGHTGGTLDKLSAITGYTPQLDTGTAHDILERVGCFIAGADHTLVPADARLYALRDHTATVPAAGLIAASIMSKKIAGGAPNLLIDIKYGRAAFTTSRNDALHLAQLMGKIAQTHDINYAAVLTPMYRPTGTTIGNACEVREALDVLNGRGPADTRALTLTLAHHALTLAGIDHNATDVAAALDNGTAAATFAAMIDAQGGNIDQIADARCRHVVRADRDGFVHLDALGLGQATWTAGAGRSRPNDPIDPSCGIVLHAQHGDPVCAGDSLCVIEGNDDQKLRAAIPTARNAITITAHRPQPAAEPIIWTPRKVTAS